MISIKDIARLSNVSTATVSRIVNNKGGYSKNTESKVLKIINDFGYVSNMAAKSLRQSKSNTIAIIVPDISNGFFSSIVLHLESAFRNAGYSTLICNTNDDHDIEKEYHRSLSSQLVSGIVAISGLKTLTDELISKTPIVCIDRIATSNIHIPIVRNDDLRASFEATELLISKGCKKILFLSGAPASSHLINRREGFLQALSAHKLPIDYNLLSFADDSTSNLDTTSILSKALQRDIQFDGILATSDRIALTALNTLKNLGISVPSEVKIMSFDDSLYARLPTPSLSSISRNVKELALNAASIILNILNDENYSAPKEVIVPHTIIERESTL